MTSQANPFLRLITTDNTKSFKHGKSIEYSIFRLSEAEWRFDTNVWLAAGNKKRRVGNREECCGNSDEGVFKCFLEHEFIRSQSRSWDFNATWFLGHWNSRHQIYRWLLADLVSKLCVSKDLRVSMKSTFPLYLPPGTMESCKLVESVRP